MNEQNFEYLKDNIKYMGFGEKLHTELENQLRAGNSEFQLTAVSEINRKQFEAKLQFRKSDNSDMYFFNSYTASLQKSNGEKVEQKFYLDKGKGVTAKEAYNLLEGRAVYKELTNKANEPYKAWIQIDFSSKDKNNNHEMKQFHENYGYDLMAVLSKYALPALLDSEKEKALLQSLQKGNVQSVMIEKEGRAVKAFIEANPQFKTINLYDGEFKRVQKENLEQYRSLDQAKSPDLNVDLTQSISKEQKNSQKEAQVESLEETKKKRLNKKGLSV